VSENADYIGISPNGDGSFVITVGGSIVGDPISQRNDAELVSEWLSEALATTIDYQTTSVCLRVAK
jgi:hypothetical protein